MRHSIRDEGGAKQNWRASAAVDGTPGFANPPPADVPAIIINELLTASPQGPEDAVELEFGELGGRGDHIVRLRPSLRRDVSVILAVAKRSAGIHRRALSFTMDSGATLLRSLSGMTQSDMLARSDPP